MQTYEFLRHKGNVRRGTYFALSVSVAFHMVIFLILITASAAPAILKIGEDQIIHVFLASLEAGQGDHTWNSQSPGELNKNKKIVEVVNAVIPVETKDRKEADVEPVTHQSREEAFRTAEASISQIRGSDVIYVAPAHAAHNAEGEHSGPSPTREGSLAVPRYRENSPPAYPSIARMRGYEGIVLLTAEIFTDGGVGSLRIKKSSGYEVLDRSAMKAVKTWKFEPGTRLGKPVNMWVDVPVKFILKDTEAI